MKIKIEPFDTLFFRSGQPFRKGQDTYTGVQFPPLPSVFYGALRTAYFFNHPNEIKLAQTPDDPTKNLEINLISIYCEDWIYFHRPNDVVTENGECGDAFILDLQHRENLGYSNYPLEYYLINKKEDSERTDNCFCSLESLEEYLRDEKEIPLIDVSEIITTEPKIGLQRIDTKHTSDEGALYTYDLLRFEANCGFLIDFMGLELPDEGILKLGGEGKASKFKVMKDDIDIYPAMPDLNDTNIFKLIFITPAIFKKGWIPDWIDETTWEGEFGGLRMKLIAVSMGRPMVIHGYDIKKRMPKPSFKAVPYGSVYYFKVVDGDKRKLKDFHGKSWLQGDFRHYAKQGFGIGLIGKGKVK